MMLIAQRVEPATGIAERAADGLIYVVFVVLVVVVLLAISFYRLRIRARPQAAGEQGFDQSSVVSPEQAKAGAQKGLETYGLLERSDWRPLLLDRQVLEPLLVERLDATDVADAFYYLVPIGASDQAVSAVARVDGLSGEYLEISAFVPGSWGAMIREWRTEAATPGRMAVPTLDRGSSGGTSAADARGVGIHPPLVWKPCVESRSPFYPFKRRTTRSLNPYLRIDGKEFGSLTDLGPGSLGTHSD